MNSQFFYLLGNRGFPLPNWPDTTAINCEIHWVGFPRSWPIVDSFGVANGVQRFQTTMDGLRKAVFVGGDFRVLPVSKAHSDLQLVIRGSWQFSDEHIAKTLDLLYQTDMAIWRDAGLKKHFVWVLPSPGLKGAHGEGRTHGFVFYASAETEEIHFTGVLSHELFHAWNPGRISIPDFDERLYWFTEGVTDLYADVALLQTGIWSFAQFVSAFNRVSRDYYSSPKRNLTADQMVVQRRTNTAAERLPYQQGFLLSANWNMQIRDRSHGTRSMDTVLRQLQNTSRAALSNDRIANALAVAGLPEARAEIEQSIQQGETIKLLPNVLGSCTSGTMTAGFVLGFDYEKSRQANRIQNVDPASAAYDAGLRDGQTMLNGEGIAFGDPSHRAHIEISDERGQRSIRFYPASRDRFIPQFRIDKTDESCTKLLR